MDRPGRDVCPPTDWLSAEHALDESGIGFLAGPFELRLEDGTWQQVRVVEVSLTLIRLKKGDFGSIRGPRVEYTLPFPAPTTLRPASAGSGH